MLQRLDSGGIGIAALGERPIGHGVARVRRPMEQSLLEKHAAIDRLREAPAERAVPQDRVPAVERDQVNQGLGVSADLDLGCGLEGRDLIGGYMSRQADLALDQGSDHGPGVRKAKLSNPPDRCPRGGLGRAGDCTKGAAQLNRTVRRRDAQKRAVADEQATLLHGGHPAVDPGVRRADRPLEPGTQLEEGSIEPDLDAGVVGRFDPVEQVGPPRLELGELGSLRSMSARATSAAVTWRDPIGPGNSAAAAGRSADGPGLTFPRPPRAARGLACPGLVAVGREDRPIEQPAHTRIGRRSQPRAEGPGHVAHGNVERGHRLEGPGIKTRRRHQALARCGGRRPGHPGARARSVTRRP